MMKRIFSLLLALAIPAALFPAAGARHAARAVTLPEEPTLTSDKVVYHGFNGGSDANSGLTASARKQYLGEENGTGAISLLAGEGGTVVTVTKSWTGTNGYTIPALGGKTVVLTARDPNGGTSYLGDLSNDTSGEYGYLMIVNTGTLHIAGNVILREIGLLERTERAAASHGTTLNVKNGACLVVESSVTVAGKKVKDCYAAPVLSVEEGGVVFLHTLGFLGYTGKGTIVIGSDLQATGSVSAAQFAGFGGQIVDAAGNPYAFGAGELPEEPVLTNTETYAYVSLAGNNANDGLTPATLKQGWGAGAGGGGVMTLVMNGGTIVIPQKGYVSANYSTPRPSSPVRLTAVDRDGTDYRGNVNDSSDQRGAFMVANSCTITFNGDFIFDDIILLDRTSSTASIQTTYAVSSGSRLVIGAGTEVCCMASALNPPILRVETGGVAFLHAVGFDRYEGSGTIVLDRSIVNTGVLYSSEFSAFTGRLIDETGAEISPSDFADKPQEIKPDDVFLSGSYTASNGCTIPYRYYLPEGYDGTKRYPLFLNMHGNGSRGSDNHKQLTFVGAVLNTAVFQSGYECIMLAPQCPSSSAWVPDTGYPGSRGFLTREMSPYLAAAKELLDKFLAEYAVDLDRVYVSGSSNGGAASWELCYRFPDLFAAAVPMAGVRPFRDGEAYEDASAEIAGVLAGIPIWTFHGTADTTLPVEGTRNLVNAIKAAGGEKILYTEYPGATHGTIWALAAKTAGVVDWIFAQSRSSGASPVSAETDAPSGGTETVFLPLESESPTVTAPAFSTNAPDGTESSVSGTEPAAEEPVKNGKTGLILALAGAALLCAGAITAALLLAKKKKAK
ncbi:MAG: hypothetical protein IJR89_04660 [Clostridia bacterium]|nr:hypothetical protein [Clostridia bacterium]